MNDAAARETRRPTTSPSRWPRRIPGWRATAPMMRSATRSMHSRRAARRRSSSSGGAGRETATARGQYAAAWRDISAVSEPANATEASRLYSLRQTVALRAGQPVEAVRAGVARAHRHHRCRTQCRAARPALRPARRHRPRAAHRSRPPRASPPRGWLRWARSPRPPARARSAPRRRSTAGARASPGHPAATIAYAEIVAPASRTTPGATPVASGSSHRAAAAAVRRQCHQLGRRTGARRFPRRRLAPARSQPARGARLTPARSRWPRRCSAQSDGAGFIVGPLTREQAQQAAGQRPGVMPMLLLNNLATDAFPGAQLFQYALAPEDEARAADRPPAQCRRPAPRSSVRALRRMGQPCRHRLRDEMVRGGGRVVAQGSYDLARNDITPVITAALGVDAARARQARIARSWASRWHGSPSPVPTSTRSSSPATSPWRCDRSIRSSRFNAGGVPTYMTQDGLDPDERGNRDLEGMRFVDLPWASSPPARGRHPLGHRIGVERARQAAVPLLRVRVRRRHAGPGAALGDTPGPCRA